MVDIAKLVDEARFKISMEESETRSIHERFEERTNEFIKLIRLALDELNSNGKKIVDGKIKSSKFLLVHRSKLVYTRCECYCKRLKVSNTDTNGIEYKIPINKDGCFVLVFRQSDCKMVLYKASYHEQLRIKQGKGKGGVCTYIGEFNSCEQLLRNILPDLVKAQQ